MDRYVLYATSLRVVTILILATVQTLYYLRIYIHQEEGEKEKEYTYIKLMLH